MIDSAETVLPEPDFTHQGHGLALADAERDAIDRAAVVAAGTEIDRQVADVDQGCHRLACAAIT